MTAVQDRAELQRTSALFTTPRDALAGAGASGPRSGSRTLLAAGVFVCLYGAGTALDDWADRAQDAVERPRRPIPSGRITPGQAPAAATGPTTAGIGPAPAAGRPAALTATALAGAAWAYDLRLKHTPAAAATATARGPGLLLQAVATAGSPAAAGRPGPAARRAVLPAAALKPHAHCVTAVGRTETRGGAPDTAPAAPGATAATGVLTGRGRGCPARTLCARTRAALAGVYAATAAGPCPHPALNPSPPPAQRAVGGGIRAIVPLRAVLTARSGPLGAAALITALAPVTRRPARKVSPA